LRGRDWSKTIQIEISENLKKFIKKIAYNILHVDFLREYKKKKSVSRAIEMQSAMLSYSQQGEDLHIQRFFGQMTKGFYIDVGAYHPFEYSNTALFYEQGWRGINIDPNPEHFKLFQRFRPRDINLNLAVGIRQESLTYHSFNAPALNSFSEVYAMDWANRQGYYIKEKIEIVTIPLVDVLNEYLPEGQAIDFMTIDTEGWDIYVLQSNDWRKYRPRLLIVEACINPLIPVDELEISKFLTDVGYRFWSASGGSLMFQDQSFIVLK
jgi:FkbM family methyltransferase